MFKTLKKQFKKDKINDKPVIKSLVKIHEPEILPITYEHDPTTSCGTCMWFDKRNTNGPLTVGYGCELHMTPVTWASKTCSNYDEDY